MKNEHKCQGMIYVLRQCIRLKIKDSKTKTAFDSRASEINVKIFRYVY